MSNIITFAHLDQGESATFLRELETIDKVAYEQLYPQLLSRQLIPNAVVVDPTSTVYTYRMWDKTGSAKVIAPGSDDLPSSEMTGKEFSINIKTVGSSYQYELDEVVALAKLGRPIDQMRSAACRYVIEQQVDQMLAIGSADDGLQGLLNLDSTGLPAAQRVSTFTLSTKKKGGVSWGTVANPNATGQEAANDLIGACSALVKNTKGIYRKFRIVLSYDAYNFLAAARLNSVNDTTALDWVLRSGYVESVTPWFRCTGAGAGATDRVAIFPGDSDVVAGIVSMEYTPLAPQQLGFKFKVPARMKTGGTFCRRPGAMFYADGT